MFEYSTEAQMVKSKLDSEDISTMLMDEKTIDSDPLISQAIGGVKLLVHKRDFIKAKAIFDQIREYETDDEGNPMYCIKCNSSRILIAPLERKNIFFMLFPFFERKRYFCNSCNTIF